MIPQEKKKVSTSLSNMSTKSTTMTTTGSSVGALLLGAVVVVAGVLIGTAFLRLAYNSSLPRMNTSWQTGTFGTLLAFAFFIFFVGALFTAGVMFRLRYVRG